MAATIRPRREIARGWRLALAGTPGFLLLIGAYAFVSGTLVVWLGLTVRRRLADRGLARAARARPAGAR